jgi:hypothetical protein
MTRYRVTFTVRDLPGLLDMLRYDQAQVVDWDHFVPSPAEKRWTVETFTATLTGKAPTVDRWRSFGLVPRDMYGVVL